MRKIKLNGARNARDLGTIINKEGRAVKCGRLLRSAQLQKLSDEDCTILFGRYNLRTVIDLRTGVERADEPDRSINCVRNVHIPIFTEEAMGITHENNTDKRKMLENLPDMRELYALMVTDKNCVAAFKRVFETIAAAKDNEAVLWHCTEGKDRCGLVSALMLFILDVDEEVIIEDYLLTNEAAEKKARKLRFLVKYLLRQSEKADYVYEIYHAREAYIDAALDAIDSTYGSIDSFIENELGITEQIKQKLKDRYLCYSITYPNPINI